MRIRLLVAQNSTLLRQGLIRLLSGDRDIEVIGEASNGVEALQKTKEIRPDAVLLDRNLPGLDGIAATRLITREVPGTKVVLLSFADGGEDQSVLEAVRAGARGYVTQATSAANLIQHIKQVVAGGVALSDEITSKLLDSLARDLDVIDGSRSEPDALLTSRERAVLNLICQGAPNKEIASTLFISENTVRAHVRSLMQKMKADNRTRLAIQAVKYGYGLQTEEQPARQTGLSPIEAALRGAGRTRITNGRQGDQSGTLSPVGLVPRN
jgi:two-component system NarL family response regulator